MKRSAMHEHHANFHKNLQSSQQANSHLRCLSPAAAETRYKGRVRLICEHPHLQPFCGPCLCRGVALRSVAISDVKDVTTEVRGEARKS